MIVVAIIGILAAIAIPSFLRFQLKSKSSEAKINLAAIRAVETAYYAEIGTFTSAAPEPVAIPGTAKAPFVLAGSDFAELGWSPEGAVYFSYGVGITADGAGFTADAGADLDGNGTNQYWGYAKPNVGGTVAASRVGCPIASLVIEQVAPCDPFAGQSVF